MANGKRILINGSHPSYLLNLRGDLIGAMVAAGHEVHATSPDLDWRVRQALEARGAHLHEVELDRRGLHLSADLRYFRALRSLIRSINPDLVFNYTIKPNIWGSLAARSCGVASASMVTGLGYAFTHSGGLVRNAIGAASRGLYRLATNANRAVIFQNSDDLEDFVAAGALGDRAKARLVNGSGVDVDHFTPVPLPERPAFLMIARLLGNKGAREYARAAIDLMARGSDARFMLAGFLDNGVDAVTQQELDGWIAQGIEFLGELDDVRPALGQCNIYVLPSYREGTPRTVLEAAAMGRPVITSDAPGCRETVIHGENGLLVPVRDVGALSAAMEQLANNPALRRRMGEAGRKYCEEKYAVENVNRTLMTHLCL